MIEKGNGTGQVSRRCRHACQRGLRLDACHCPRVPVRAKLEAAASGSGVQSHVASRAGSNCNHSAGVTLAGAPTHDHVIAIAAINVEGVTPSGPK